MPEVSPRAAGAIAGVLGVGILAGVLLAGLSGTTTPEAEAGARAEAVTEPAAVASPSPTPAAAPSPEPAPSPTTPVLGAPWGSTAGLLQFRGNPAHTFYGTGPVPSAPDVAWRYPDSPMCVDEVVGQRSVTPSPTDAQPSPKPTVVPEIKRWCGTGWTGQPLVWERDDGVTEVIVGAYDGAIHFVDRSTGQRTRPPFQTGFMIKGTLTLDPDGYPLLYGGSRDGYLRVIALDRDVPTELWRLGRHPQGIWNDDWDGNPSIVDGVLYVGGEDSWFRAIDLRRSTDDDGRVQVQPEVLVEVPGFDEQLFAATGDRNVSIESSVVVDVERQRVYLANSGGRVMGLDVSDVRAGVAPVVFDTWLGDDIDASLVLDPDGSLYASVELERATARASEVGQLVKLDPFADDDPVVWGVPIPPRPDIPGDDGGSWSTPALHDGTLWVTTHPGDLLAVDAAAGEVRYRERIGYHEWSSPAVVLDGDGTPVLITALCQGGGLRAYDITDPAAPVERWTARIPSGACIESTPAVWAGGITVGSRDGYLYHLADPR